MKKAIIGGILLIIIGGACFGGAFVLAGYDIYKLSTATYETNTYTPEGSFTKIDLSTHETNVELKVAEDGVCRIVCVEQSKAKHSVTIESDTLVVKRVDERRWFERFGFFTKSLSMTVYLPQGTYDTLKIDSSTGDVTIPEGFIFGSVDLSVSTGDVDCRSSVIGSYKIATSTGDIHAQGITAGEIDWSVSTGHVTAESVYCTGRMSIKYGTGKSSLTHVDCEDLSVFGSTGDLTLRNVLVAGAMSVSLGTGDVRFESCDAGEITVETSTGDVTGTLRTNKIFTASASTGKVEVPSGGSVGKCAINTSTGDIRIFIG